MADTQDIALEERQPMAVDMAGGEDVTFGLNISELRELMELRSGEAVESLGEKYGGVLNLCKLLHTSETEGECESLGLC